AAGAVAAPVRPRPAVRGRRPAPVPRRALKEYGFLEDVLPDHTGVEVRRASATIRLRASH
ncbi:hypothetical protein AB0G02_28785, partial [Actinosynnema sp. NPDC023658]|uniref:hypothetical protein n=1 Tax=Actinosynnema sp. NPDC023658 TaxID=3155465 RepID=UPI0033F5B444